MARPQSTPPQEYKGYTIELTSGWKFFVNWDEEEYDEYNSLQEARDAIDKQVVRDQKAARVVLSIPVLRVSNNNPITKHTVTGLNTRIGALTMTPKPDRWGIPDYYLDTPHVAGLLGDIARKEFEIAKLKERLKPVRVPDSYNRKPGFSLDRWHKSAVKKAEKL